MWRGIWISGHGTDGGQDPERKRYVAAEAARKWSARQYTNRGLEPPSSLLRRKVKEYRWQAPPICGNSSSAAMSRPHMPLPPVKREPGELPPLRAVKREAEAERRRRRAG
ncbi:hypothetical protein D1007_04350 [Hordeum vulgare]|nr:hypothetical protein D1007_04350 [Hordeum vulgare]